MAETTYTVLLVDDEEPFLDSLADGLSVYRKYFQIRTALNGAEAVKVLKLHPIHMVITGLSMPVMDGFELLAYMNRNYPKIPVVLMTAYGTPKIREIVMNMGVFRYMEKPLDINEVAGVILDALGISISQQKFPESIFDISPARKKQLLQYAERANDLMEGFYDPSVAYTKEGRYGEALFCLKELLERTPYVQDKVWALYALGQMMEQLSKFDLALTYYQEAAKFCHRTYQLFYWINNNTGYSLCMLGRYQEAERYCRIALDTDKSRANAYKNLGLALEGQGRLREAIDFYITATRINAQDVRASKHLETLLKKHPELNEEYNESLDECRAMVECARQYQEEQKKLH
ncbi:MAG TPA: response regulator [Smithellaceae bacterium]|nr:response regulator [Smithellaceae bacterium]HRS89002.1 response regulator [Smithellaceae bacterium]HRV25618.1 response regulator [Smithellaceae bacterium]